MINVQFVSFQLCYGFQYILPSVEEQVGGKEMSTPPSNIYIYILDCVEEQVGGKEISTPPSNRAHTHSWLP